MDDSYISVRYRDTVFLGIPVCCAFLDKVAPDITGFLKINSSCYFVIIEVKDDVIELDHIYQVKKYAELFGAKFAFLVSTDEIPVELKELSRVAFKMLSLPLYGKLILVQFDKDSGELIDWYVENPFNVDRHWRH
jgi:hypothetical protein